MDTIRTLNEARQQIQQSIFDLFKGLSFSERLAQGTLMALQAVCSACLAYAIGRAAPVGLYVETFGTGHVSDETITSAIREVFDLRPQAIIDRLDLLRPIYAQTAAYGHFGRELPDFTWERTDRAEQLRIAAGL